MDARVEAIRSDPKIGRGTCSAVDETMTDAAIVEECEELGIKTAKQAVRWFRRMERVFWGSD